MMMNIGAQYWRMLLQFWRILRQYWQLLDFYTRIRATKFNRPFFKNSVDMIDNEIIDQTKIFLCMKKIFPRLKKIFRRLNEIFMWLLLHFVGLSSKTSISSPLSVLCTWRVMFLQAKIVVSTHQAPSRAAMKLCHSVEILILYINISIEIIRTRRIHWKWRKLEEFIGNEENRKNPLKITKTRRIKWKLQKWWALDEFNRNCTNSK